MNPTEYIQGEAAAADVLTNVSADISVPNEIYLALARLETDAARLGFCRAIQKRLEQASRMAA